MVDVGDLRLIYELLIGGLIGHLFWKRRQEDKSEVEDKKDLKSRLEAHQTQITKLEVQQDNLGVRVDEIRSDTKDIKKSVGNLEATLAEIKGKITHG